MRKLPFSILKRLNRLLRPEYSVVRRLGAKFLLNKNNWIDNRLLCFRGYERENLSYILRELNTNQYDRFLDIGANIGFFTTMVGKRTNTAQIMSFEPMSKNYFQLCSNVLLNDLSSRVKPFCLALGSKDETSVIHYNKESTGIGTLIPGQTVRNNADYTDQEEIVCRRFDDHFPIKGEHLFIKMDVEQFEVEALKGMKQTFVDNKVLLIIEINDPQSQAFQLLEGYGMALLENKGEDYFFSNINLNS